MRNTIAFAAGALALMTPTFARAIDAPGSINEPPKGAGTQESGAPRPFGRVREGVESQAQIGTGFNETYGLGLGARTGYTFRQGLYLGGALDYWFGHSTQDESAHAIFIGADAGWKIFPTANVEIRPHVIAGPAFIKTVNDAPFYVDTKTAFAIQPGVQGLYHFGQAFIGGDARWFITPSPNTLSLTAAAGVGF
jgi:hypothetical protein